MQQITPNIYVETKRKGGNVGFVVTSEGVVLIDTPQRPSDVFNWRDEIAKRGEACWLINTEHHIDHFIGNYFFPGVAISHEEARTEIKHFPMEKIWARFREIDPEAMPLLEKYHIKVPTVTFSECLSLYLGNHVFHLIHTPGHTSGQIAVYIPKERVVFTGDTVSYKVQIYLHESNPFQWLESLKKIEALEVDIIVSGHGEICDKSYIPEAAAFVQEWIDTVRKAIAHGLTREQAMDVISLLDRYPMAVSAIAKGSDVQRRNVDHLYDLLKK